MNEPVATVDGNVYEKAAIRNWCRRGNRTSPKTDKNSAVFLRGGRRKRRSRWDCFDCGQQSRSLNFKAFEPTSSAAGPASDSISFYNLPQTGVPEWLGQSQEKVQRLVTVLRYQLSHGGSLICKAIRSLPSTREWE